MQSLTTLPEGYAVKHTFDAKNVVLAVGMNIAGLILAFLFGGICAFLVSALRAVDVVALFLDWLYQPFFSLVTVVLIFVVLVCHELIHGVGFWWFTRAKPVFGGNLFVMYAGAPGWYIPARQHFVIGIAPLVVLTILGLVLMLVVPASWLLSLLFLTAFQAGGAFGDILVCGFELAQPRSALVEDTGLKMTIYRAE